MAPLRREHTRSRPRRPAQNAAIDLSALEHDELADFAAEEPPRKRLRTSQKSKPRSRWIPGGRGGGGRHVDAEEYAAIMAATPRGGDDSHPPRSRTGRHQKRSSRPAPRSSAPSSRRPASTRPRYSTAAAASAAVAHGDGYKPREERGWEEFHPDLDLDSAFAVIESEEVDGIVKKPEQVNGLGSGAGSERDECENTQGTNTPTRRRAGRPVRTRDSMLNGLLTPEAPKFVPIPAPNPREKLLLPKPSYRELDPFLSYEHKDIAQINFVDKTMAHVGYQEGELYPQPGTLVRQMEGSAEEDLDLSPSLAAEGENSAIGSSGVGRVEYDMDEQDVKWLDALNEIRKKDGVGIIRPAVFEITMTKIEKEWHALEKRIPKPNPKAPQTQRPRSSSAAAVNGEPGAGEEPDSKCAICDDGDCENANAIVFCDGCDLAVHQECYGVPYIPEGQWLCRKCQLVGSARPSCIFCPNEGGAFKQTNNSKWAHLFCATWIPEVTIGNPSLMEPITDVEKVPNGRWKLECYICRQRMGASIQCSDARCYDAFHLTCARQAGLYLRMKTGGGQNTLMDQAHLRAYCHKHTPTEWRMEHNTDHAVIDAMAHFKRIFKNQVWADSRASALAQTDAQFVDGSEPGPQRIILTNRKGQKQKTVWRMPSGAPVIPEVILKSIEESLVRFLVQRKKEYAAEVCKYWTLKREARRGAALLKRLQLQMDTFSSFEVTRRDYKAQGAAGRARLERRIRFAETLAADLDRIRQLCDLVKQREAEKLQDALLLKDIVDIIYFPIPPMLLPMLEKALRQDTRDTYRAGLQKIHAKVLDRTYTSVATFSADLAQVFSSDLGVEATTTAELQAQIQGRRVDLPLEQRERRTVARRILKALQPQLEDAIKKEAELTGRPYAQQLKEMDEMLFSRRGSTDGSLELAATSAAELTNGTHTHLGANGNANAAEAAAAADIEMTDAELERVVVNGQVQPLLEDASMTDISMRDVSEVAPDRTTSSNGMQLNGDRDRDRAIDTAALLLSANTPPASTNGIIKQEISQAKASSGIGAKDPDEAAVQEPPTPPMSLEGTQVGNSSSTQPPQSNSQSQSQSAAALVHGGGGGIPWYVEQFDPEGTIVYDERWLGPEVLRGMSEELSEMDDDELDHLGGFGGMGGFGAGGDGVDGALVGEDDDDDKPANTRAAATSVDPVVDPAAVEETKKNKKRTAKKVKKGNDWGRRGVRSRR